MVRILYITFIALAVCMTAGAQNMGHGIIIEDLRTGIDGEQLDIRFNVRTTGLIIKSDDRLKMEFAVEGQGRRLILPAVIYSGKIRNLYEQRRALLSGLYQVEPYHVYKGVKNGEDYSLDYNLSVPYQSWMRHAALSYRLYSTECSGEKLAHAGTLVSDLDPEPEVWRPDSSLFGSLVSFLVPEVEEVKARASLLSLSIGFPTNVTEVRPDFGDNRYELKRADSLVSSLHSNELVNVKSVHIRGYASPEGRLEINERLAKGRCENFKKYLVSKYPGNRFIAEANTTWVAEDWAGLAKLIENNKSIVQKQEIIDIATDNTIASDAKDRLLQNVVWWSQNYKMVLRDIYPQLRRIELRVDYTVDDLSDAQAQELLHTNPSMLSIKEMYRAASYYEPGSRQYLEVYIIAARQYPGDLAANNNAAAALLQQGKADEALEYLVKTAGNNLSLINYGAYYYIKGEPEKALEYFARAKEAGIAQGEYNAGLVSSGRR